MVIFNSYVSLPEGITGGISTIVLLVISWPQLVPGGSGHIGKMARASQRAGEGSTGDPQVA